MDGTDLAKVVSTKSLCTSGIATTGETSTAIPLQQGDPRASSLAPARSAHVVAYDFGIKHNILRMLSQGSLPGHGGAGETSAEDVLALKPDGIFLSNGPG